MKNIILFSLTALTCTVAMAQTPTIDAGGVVNVASYTYAGLPGAGIAQGSIFGIFGKNLGPATFVQATTYPLPTTLSGVTVKVTSGSTSANAILFFVSATQINALLPSSIAAGTASLTVTNNGATSAAASFQVVTNNFNIFSLNQAGTGPGVITNPQSVPFTLTNSANPGEPAVIYGTGLAAVQGNEAGGALPGDMPSVPLEIYVGGVKATVTYRGRSGCCAGLDQVTFTVPNVTGCRVPVNSKINNTVGNFTTMSIAPAGTRTCTDPNGPSAADLQKFSNQGAVSVGAVVLARVNTSIVAPVIGTFTTSADVGSAVFERYTTTQLNASPNPFNTYTVGSCSVNYYKGASSGTAADPTLPKYLDAGTALTVSGAGGSKQLTKSNAALGVSTYSGLLGSSSSGAPGFLDPGTFTISGPGGTDIGGFNAQLPIAATLTWNDTITDVTRSAGQAITWSGGDPSSTVIISGSSQTGSDANAVGANFTCFAKVGDKQFTVPAQVLLALPPSVVVSGVPTGALFVGTNTVPKPFTATGLDLGYLISTTYSLKTVNYK